MPRRDFSCFIRQPHLGSFASLKLSVGIDFWFIVVYTHIDAIEQEDANPASFGDTLSFPLPLAAVSASR